MPKPAAILHTLSPSRVREAELLADMLRISRLTILYGEAGVGKTTLLVTGVLPLLGRRGADRGRPHIDDSGVVVPFPKCRRRERSAHAEVAVFFDAWNEAPLATLTERLLDALPGEHAHIAASQSTLSDTLTALSRDLGARFLILLDRFEEYLTAPPDRPGIPEFADEFLRMLQNPQLPANFLVSVQEYAEPLMERLRARVRGLGDASLRLEPLDKVAPSLVQSLHEHEHARARRAHLDQPLEGSAAEPQLSDASDGSSAETLIGSETDRQKTAAAFEAAQYEWALACDVAPEAIAYSPAQNIWATFGTAQHEWTLAFHLAGQNTAESRETSPPEGAPAIEETPVAVSNVDPTPESSTASPELSARDEDVLAPEAVPQDSEAASEAAPEAASTAYAESAQPQNELAFEAVPQDADTASEPTPEEKHLDAATAEPVMEAAQTGHQETELASTEMPVAPEPASSNAEAVPGTITDEPRATETANDSEPVSIAVSEESRASEEASIESPVGAEAVAASIPPGAQAPSDTSAKRRMSRGKWLAAAGAVTAVAVAVWTVHNVPLEQLPAFISRDTATSEPAPQPTRDAPPPEPALPPLPQIALVTEPGNSTDAQIAADLARVTTADRSVHVAHRADMLSWPDDDVSRLAILRYEALDAANRARARTGKGSDRVRIVTALYTEEIHIIARRDSPLNFVHEIANAKLNVGPSTASRGLTAARLYERMFGKPIPQANVSAFPDDEALNKLVNEKSIDAMIVIAGQPSAWLAEIPPQLASSIKLLKHDRAHPAGQKAIEAYLPTTIRSQSYRKWLDANTPALATMTFLVASEGSSAEALERFDLFTQSFCRNLDRLRREGHPKWREIQLGFEIDTGWPYSARAKSAFQACLAETQRTAAPTRR